MTPNNIPNITTQNGMIRYVRPINTGEIRISNITPPWMAAPPQALPIVSPVTVQVGVPIVDMPGCVKMHKENASSGNKSSSLVNDDPDQNVVLCDGGMPYFEPPDYQADELNWQTVYGEPEEQVSGVDTGEPLGAPEADVEPPETPTEDKEVPCPGPANLRVGDITQAGDERVTGHQLIEDPNNPKVQICETLYESTTVAEKFLPSINQTTTTVAIAVVATAGAAATPLLLRIFKPIITKIYKTIQKKLGKKPVRLSRNDIIANEYRAKKGLPPFKTKE